MKKFNINKIQDNKKIEKKNDKKIIIRNHSREITTEQEIYNLEHIDIIRLHLSHKHIV